MTRLLTVALCTGALVAMSSAAIADSERGRSTFDYRYPGGYDYNVPLALPP